MQRRRESNRAERWAFFLYPHEYDGGPQCGWGAPGSASALQNQGDTRFVQLIGKRLGIPTAMGDTDHNSSLPFSIPQDGYKQPWVPPHYKKGSLLG